jgi:UDP-N-acetylglucosamine--N-acetylmuramyl-(pentapeptide) pyrophosphoryl-undecaprenol N-acetylglucosamine transferase
MSKPTGGKRGGPNCRIAHFCGRGGNGQCIPLPNHGKRWGAVSILWARERLDNPRPAKSAKHPAPRREFCRYRPELLIRVSPRNPYQWLRRVYSHLMRVILAGGGTGGHVIPALAIANELRRDYTAEALFIGTARGIESRLVPAAGYPLKLLRVGALKNVGLTTRLKTLFDLPRAVWDAGRILNEFAPDAVIGVGGYASGPAMLAAVVKHIPTLAFEPNVVPGFANRVVARFVSAAAVHFAETAKYFRKAEVTGVPVRQAFFEIPPKRGGTPTLLVFGGSQGAHAINEAVIRCLPELTRQAPGIRILHQTGERDYNDAAAAYRSLVGSANCAEVFKFIEDMSAAFARADLVVCRSGASTVAEITAAGKPAIFVPFPYAADDHQSVNAEALARAGAAVVVEESKLEGVWLAETCAALLNDVERLARMSVAARGLAHPNAARDIAAMAARIAGIEVAHSPKEGI